MPNIKCYISGLGFTLRAYATPQRCSSYAWRHKQWFCPGRWGQWWSAQSQQLQRLINYSCCNFTRLHLCKQKTNQTLLTTTTPFKTKQKRFPKEAKTNKQTTTRTTFPFAWRWFKQKSQQEQEAGCPQLRVQPKNINLKKWMLYNPAMLRKMEFVDIGRCNAPPKFSPFFCQNGKNYPTSLAWFCSYCWCPLTLPKPPPLPLKNKSEKSTKEIKKGFW